MSANWKTFTIVALVVAIGAIFVAMIYSKNKENKNQTQTSQTKESGHVAGASTQQSTEYIEKLAKALTDKGAVLFGAYWCSHCKDQKALFGEAEKYIDYVECDSSGPNANSDECKAQKIESYPTWIYEGKQYKGTQSLAKLAEMIGFTE